MRPLLLAALLGGCVSAGPREEPTHTKRVDYLFGPAIIWAPKAEMQAACWRWNSTDLGTGELIRADQIGACYDREVKAIRLPWFGGQDYEHEMCHYRCDKAKDIHACDVACHTPVYKG